MRGRFSMRQDFEADKHIQKVEERQDDRRGSPDWCNRVAGGRKSKRQIG